MTNLIALIPYLIAGLLCVTLIASLGAYISRRLNFQYGYLAILSFIVYGTIGALIAKEIDLGNAFLVNLMIGFYDATAGWKLARKFKANMREYEEAMKERSLSTNLAIMLFISSGFTYLGYLLTT